MFGAPSGSKRKLRSLSSGTGVSRSSAVRVPSYRRSPCRATTWTVIADATRTVAVPVCPSTVRRSTGAFDSTTCGGAPWDGVRKTTAIAAFASRRRGTAVPFPPAGPPGKGAGRARRRPGPCCRCPGPRPPGRRDAGRGERRGELPRLRTLVVHEERLLSGTFQAQSTDPGRGGREGRGGSAGRRDPRGGLRRILRPVRAGRAPTGEEPVQCPRQLVVKTRRFARREVADGDEDTAAVHEADERVHASILARTAIEDEPAATGRGRLSPRRRSVRTAGPPASRCCR